MVPPPPTSNSHPLYPSYFHLLYPVPLICIRCISSLPFSSVVFQRSDIHLLKGAETTATARNGVPAMKPQSGAGNDDATPAAAAKKWGSRAGPMPSPLELGFVPRVLTHAQICTFLRDGVVVVPCVLTPAEIARSREGLRETLGAHGVDASTPESLSATSSNVTKLSSTGFDLIPSLCIIRHILNLTSSAELSPPDTIYYAPVFDMIYQGGAGGVLDIFYPLWKLQATLENQRYHGAYCDLLQASYGSYGKKHGDDDSKGDPSSSVWQHSFGSFDASRSFAHVDRIGFRLPDSCISATVADQSRANEEVKAATTRRKQKRAVLQRSLTPHFDCCPTSMDEGAGKKFPRWRPIQCMLSLTDNELPDTGGFECVRGFHHDFAQYYATGTHTSSGVSPVLVGRGKGVNDSGAAVCKGDFCPIRPREDQSVIAAFRHISVKAGEAVFWDQRIPHSNSRRNTSDIPREVIYGGFLPRIPRNDTFAVEQLRRMKRLLPQVDFWIETDEDGSCDSKSKSTTKTEAEDPTLPLSSHAHDILQ
jgi:hypothetical protein